MYYYELKRHQQRVLCNGPNDPWIINTIGQVYVKLDVDAIQTNALIRPEIESKFMTKDNIVAYSIINMC